MAGIGPLEFLVVAFPGEDLPNRVAAMLRAVERGGDVRVVDALAVAKDRDGRVSSAELTEVPSLAGPGVSGCVTGPGAGLIDAADVDEVGQALDAGTVALAVLVEHAWARRADAVVGELGGVLVGAVRIPEAYVNEARASRDLPGHHVR